jgi:hypothetical protein
MMLALPIEQNTTAGIRLTGDTVRPRQRCPSGIWVSGSYYLEESLSENVSVRRIEATR